MKMKMLGFADTDFEKGVNEWLAENLAGIKIHHVTAFLSGERWFSVLVFYE